MTRLDGVDENVRKREEERESEGVVILRMTPHHIQVLELNVLCFLWPAKRFLVLLVIVCSYKITLHLLIYLGIFW